MHLGGKRIGLPTPIPTTSSNTPATTAWISPHTQDQHSRNNIVHTQECNRTHYGIPTHRETTIQATNNNSQHAKLLLVHNQSCLALPLFFFFLGLSLPVPCAFACASAGGFASSPSSLDCLAFLMSISIPRLRARDRKSNLADISSNKDRAREKKRKINK